MDTKDTFDISKVRVDHSGSGEQKEHHSSHKHHRHHQHKKKSKWKKILLRVLLLVVMLLIGVVIGLVSLYFTGKSALHASTEEVSQMRMAEGTEAENQESLPAGVIRHNGNIYRYREDNINILFIGVDTAGTNDNQIIQGGGNGQSDVIILANLNPKDGKITLIPINRDTMTRISVKNSKGEFVGYEEAQLALSYAYGDDAEDSAVLTKEAVSYLFYGLPIQGYYSMTMDGITKLNDLVGWVDVVLPEDYVEEWGDGYMKGATVHLTGAMAETYIRTRQNKADGSNAMRMERQKSYLIALAQKVLAESAKNPSLPVKLYQGTEEYRNTDIALNEFTYLAGQAVQCGFSEEDIRKVEGTINNDHEYAEFHTDDQALYDLILDVFYEEL